MTNQRLRWGLRWAIIPLGTEHVWRISAIDVFRADWRWKCRQMRWWESLRDNFYSCRPTLLHSSHCFKRNFSVRHQVGLDHQRSVPYALLGPSSGAHGNMINATIRSLWSLLTRWPVHTSIVLCSWTTWFGLIPFDPPQPKVFWCTIVNIFVPKWSHCADCIINLGRQRMKCNMIPSKKYHDGH